MEDEAAKVMKKMAHRDTTLLAKGLRLLAPVMAMVLLLWIIHLDFEVAIKMRTDITTTADSSNWSFHFGVITLLFGFLFLALGIPILVNLFLKLSQQLQKQEETGIYQAGEKKTTLTIIIRIFLTLFTILVLAWATYTGFRLATEPTREGKYHPLAFPIGVMTILFGLVYIIIGLAIIGDLVIYLIAQSLLREKKGILIVQLLLGEKKGIMIHKDSNTDDKSVV